MHARQISRFRTGLNFDHFSPIRSADALQLSQDPLMSFGDKRLLIRLDRFQGSDARPASEQRMGSQAVAARGAQHDHGAVDRRFRSDIQHNPLQRSFRNGDPDRASAVKRGISIHGAPCVKRVRDPAGNP